MPQALCLRLCRPVLHFNMLELKRTISWFTSTMSQALPSCSDLSLYPMSFDLSLYPMSCDLSLYPMSLYLQFEETKAKTLEMIRVYEDVIKGIGVVLGFKLTPYFPAAAA